MRTLRNILFVFVLVFAVVSCKKQKPSHEESKGKPVVLVSIAPYKTMVEKIAGDTVQVETIVPKGASPHGFEPSPKNVEHLKDAKVWFIMGEGFEQKLTSTIKDYNEDIVIFDLRKNIDLLCQDEEFIEHSSHGCMGHEGGDVHLWLSPMLMRYQIHHIGHTLQRAFPEHGKMYEENLMTLSKQLAELNEEVKQNMYPFHRRVIVVSHPAFGYFCQDYQCVQIPVEVEGKDPPMKHIEAILERARKNKAKVVIAIPQYNNRGAQLIAKRLNLPLVTFDPYAPEYIENVKRLSEIIGRTDQEDEKRD